MNKKENHIVYEALLIPGGGLRAGQVPPWTALRLDRALQLSRTGNNPYIITLSAGTVHKPLPQDTNGYSLMESQAAAEYLLERGIDPLRILTETSSYDTIGNAFFSRVIHVDPMGLHRLAVITSAFHMARTEAVFRWVYGLPCRSRDADFQLSFQTVDDADTGLSEDAIHLRREKELQGLERVRQKSKEITSLEDLHTWLFTRHGAYAAARPLVKLTGDILETY